MSLLGIDIGTTGCKAASFSEDGELLAIAYQEYNKMHLSARKVPKLSRTLSHCKV